MASPQVQSPTNVESPSAAKTAQTTGPSQMAPQSLAMDKAETGTVGSGSSQNFRRSDGPAVSPAKVASNSSRRSQTRSKSDLSQSLVSTEKSTVNRSVTGAPIPQQIVRTNSEPGSRSGTPTPQSLNESSSASIQSSSSSNQRSELSADKGSSTVDVGPQKIVANQSSRNSGGGGQPELSQQSINSPTRDSGSGPAMKPQVATTNSSPSPAAPLTQGSNPNQSRESQPNAQSAIAQRESGEPIQMGRPDDRSTQTADNASALSGNASQNRAERSLAQNSTLADSRSSSDNSNVRQSQIENRLNPMVANLPSNASQGQRTQVESDDPSEVESEAPGGSTAISKQSLPGTVSADRAQREVLVQANGQSESKIANTASTRRSRIGGEQSSSMLVGQSKVDRERLSPQIGGRVGDGPQSSSLAQSPQGNGDSDSMEPGTKAEIGKQPAGSTSGQSRADSSSPGGAGVKVANNQSTRRAGNADSALSDLSTQNRSSSLDNNQRPVVQNSPGDGLQPLPSQGENPRSQSLEGSAQVADVDKQSLPGLKVEFSKQEGAGGIGDTVSPEVGINTIRASRDSKTIQVQPMTRFRRNPETAQPKVSTKNVVATKAFSGRRRKRLSSQSPSAAKAIEMGLAFLAKQQNEDGSWSLDRLDKNRDNRNQQLSSDTAATGLALLAFQGAGFNHKEYFYADELAAAVDWLKQNQQTNGDLYVESNKRSDSSCRLYSHAIATLALCEAYGMTQDPELKSAAQKAIEFIEKSQHAELGGWRYYAEPASMRRSDTSVTGWMVMALQSARLAGLDVQEETFAEVERFLGFAVDQNAEHKFRYNPVASLDDPRKRQGRVASHSMTSVGLLLRMYTGWNRDDQRLVRGSDYLLTRLPSDATIELRDTYYWYYATQVLNHVGGERWERWNQALEPLLIRTQVQNGAMKGSWDPYYPVPDRWATFGGRIYLTTMNLLNLEVEYRKLPLYENTAK